MAHGRQMLRPASSAPAPQEDLRDPTDTAKTHPREQHDLLGVIVSKYPASRISLDVEHTQVLGNAPIAGTPTDAPSFLTLSRGSSSLISYEYGNCKPCLLRTSYEHLPRRMCNLFGEGKTSMGQWGIHFPPVPASALRGEAFRGVVSD
jgi:hypothetical protein